MKKDITFAENVVEKKLKRKENKINKYKKEYVKIKAKTINGYICRFAYQVSESIFLLVNKYGEHNNEFFIGKEEDIVWIKSAKINLFYGELKIEKKALSPLLRAFPLTLKKENKK